jgi:hypothetical protein
MLKFFIKELVEQRSNYQRILQIFKIDERLFGKQKFDSHYFTDFYILHD